MKSETETAKEAGAPEIDPTIVALGGDDIPVKFRDGRTESVKVRILEIEHFAHYVNISMQEHLCAEFVCAQPAGWGRTLSTESLLEINEKAYELNFPSARRWLDRRALIMERLAPMGAAHAKRSSSSVGSARASG